MSDQMPTGWMSADEARKWARRGCWTWRGLISAKPTIYAYADAADVSRCMLDGELWKFVGEHPDDEPAAGAVEIEAWESYVGVDGMAPTHNPPKGWAYVGTWEPVSHAMCEPNSSWQQGYSVLWRRKVRRAPTPEAVETVVGVCRE